jgi:hypothetical protein
LYSSAQEYSAAHSRAQTVEQVLKTLCVGCAEFLLHAFCHQYCKANKNRPHGRQAPDNHNGDCAAKIIERVRWNTYFTARTCSGIFARSTATLDGDDSDKSYQREDLKKPTATKTNKKTKKVSQQRKERTICIMAVATKTTKHSYKANRMKCAVLQFLATEIAVP